MYDPQQLSPFAKIKSPLANPEAWDLKAHDIWFLYCRLKQTSMVLDFAVKCPGVIY